MRKHSGTIRPALNGCSRTNPTCVLWGGYSGGNVGDKLALALALRDARARLGNSVCVLSADPEATMRFFSETPVVRFDPQADSGLRRLARSLARRMPWARWHAPKYRLRDQPPSLWLECIRTSRQLYLVGGGYLTGLFGSDYYLLPVLAAKAAGVPVKSAPIGIGPFRNRAEAAFVAEALRGADLVVRDATSLAFCREHGLAAQQALDDGFRVAEVIPGLARRSTAGHGRRIGVCIFRQYGDPDWSRTKRWWSKLLSALRGAEVSGFCFHSEPRLDYETMRELLGDGRVSPWTGDWKEAVSGLAGYDAIVSARYHAVVVANALGIPSVAVAAGDYYRAKMTAAKRPQDERCRVVNPHTDSPEEAAGHLLA